jgi:transcriptional regulator with XRE-family HTH domain
MSEDWTTIGKRLREARESRGFSQAQVAEAMNLLRPAVSMLENGDRRVNVLELKALAKLYRRPTWYLLGEENPSLVETVEDTMHQFQSLAPEDEKELSLFVEFLLHRRQSKDGHPKV